MFITGPDVIKAVTHEEVTKEDLGGATTHATKSGVCHLTSPDDKTCLAQTRELLSFLPSNNQEDPPFKPTQDPPTRDVPELDTMIPLEPSRPYDVKDVVRAVVDDGYLFEVAEAYAQNIVVGFARVGGRAVGVVAEPADGARGRARHPLVDEGRAVRPLLRLLQHPARHVRRRPRLHARHRPGVRRHHQARRQAPLRVRRGDGPQGHRDPAQGLRRRVRRHGEQAHSRRREPRVPDGRDRRHGPGGRRQHRAPRRDRAARASRRRRAPRSSPTTARSSPTRTRPPSSASSTRSSTRGRSARGCTAASRCSRTSATPTRRRSTRTSRSSAPTYRPPAPTLSLPRRSRGGLRLPSFTPLRRGEGRDGGRAGKKAIARGPATTSGPRALATTAACCSAPRVRSPSSLPACADHAGTSGPSGHRGWEPRAPSGPSRSA